MGSFLTARVSAASAVVSFVLDNDSRVEQRLNVTNVTLDLSIIATNLSTRQIVDCDVTLAKEVNKEGPMAVLLIKCPHTNRPISTGIEIDGAETLAKLPDVLSDVKCPECGLEHAWWKREAWLEERVEVLPAEDEAA
jgi:hypothetical protein